MLREDSPMSAGPDEIMDIDGLSRYLKVSKSTLYKLAQHGGLPGQKVGKQWRFHKSAIDEWLHRNPRHRRKETMHDR